MLYIEHEVEHEAKEIQLNNYRMTFGCMKQKSENIGNRWLQCRREMKRGKKGK